MPAHSFDDIWPHLLRPPGGGIYAVSAGKGAAEALQLAHYAAVTSREVAATEIESLWHANVHALSRAEVALIGVPLDTGAGIRRGAAYGPRAVRQAMLEDTAYRAWLASGVVVDIGDVLVNPHLLHDEMLSDAQIVRSRGAMYAHAPVEVQSTLPVSALSQLEHLVAALLDRYPALRLFVIGGDHSVAWPVSVNLARRHPEDLGIVQPDAHTDLLPERLGVTYCFGTWSFHANEAIGRGGKMVQLGIRQTGRDRGHWESSTGVRQFWPSEIREKGRDVVVAEIVSHLKSVGVKKVYFSNDIDGTDSGEAPSTGTPAADGLDSAFVLDVIEALGRAFELVAADVVEVAPDLGTRDESERTCRLAARYAVACLRAQLAPVR
jgi:agmatinase